MDYAALAQMASPRRGAVFGYLDEHPRVQKVLPSAFGALAGLAVWPAHPILGLVEGAVVGKKIIEIFSGESSFRDAAQSLKPHAMATAGALSLPTHPIMGYLIGAVASGIADALRPSPITIGEVIPQVGAVYTDYQTVLRVQKALKDKGIYPGDLDGVYGPITAAGVKKVQAALGAEQTGKIDYGVLLALGVPAPKEAAAIEKNAVQNLPTDGRPAKGWSQPQVITPERGIVWRGKTYPFWQVALAALTLGLGVVALGSGIYLLVAK